jgi:hypothetical protein
MRLMEPRSRSKGSTLEAETTSMNPKRIVLALGAYTLSRSKDPVRRGRQAVEDAARASFPGEEIEVVSIDAFSSFPELFEPTVEDAKRLGLIKLAGAASGQFIQEALDGSQVTDIHFDLTGVEDVLEQSQAASELRNLIAHLRAGGERKVDIHFRHTDGLSTIRKDSDRVEGAPLPDFLQQRLMGRKGVL